MRYSSYLNSGRRVSAKSCNPIGGQTLKKPNSGLGKYIVTTLLILGFGGYLSGNALAREHRSGNSYTRDRTHNSDRTQNNTSDSTPPVIQATVNGTQGSNSWYTSNVVITWSVTDAESSITSTSGCENVSLTTDTSGVTYTCQATSQGGTSSQSVTVMRDTTPPKVTIVTPASGATYARGQEILASYSCVDPISGIDTCTGTVANGANLNLILERIQDFHRELLRPGRKCNHRFDKLHRKQKGRNR